MNKSSEGKHPYLRDGWYRENGFDKIHPMNIHEPNGNWTQKEIQKVLAERNLWPAKSLNLEYTKLKCFNCQVAADCKVCEKRKRCNLCKAPRLHSTLNCSKYRKCDTCAYREEHCQCISKKYYATCTIKNGKYADCKELPPKCTSDSEFKIIISFLFY